MSAIVEASSLVRDLALPCAPGESTKAAMRRAWRKVSKRFSQNRIKDIWYADPRVRISADELEMLRSAIRDRVEEEDARAALKSVSSRLARIEAIIQADEAAHREKAAGMVGGDRAVDRAMDRRWR